MDGFWLAAIKVVIAFALLFTVVLFLVWAERRLVARMQNRIGPNRAGPAGMMQTLADGMKLMFKESIDPRRAELAVYLAAPVVALIPALLIFLIIPIGAPITIGSTTYDLQVTDLNIGVLYFLAMSSIAVYAIALAGWSSGSKYPLLGSVRASAQMISYEAALGLALVPVILYNRTTSLAEIVVAQGETYFGIFPAWNIVLIPSFIVFLIAGFAETNRAPFDLVEAEQEIVGGYHTEYSGFRFALFFLAEYINLFNIAALTVVFFLGGWQGPVFGPTFLQYVLPIFWFLLKTVAILFLFIWARASLPRMRYDQLMEFGWKRLIPLSLLWIMVVVVAVGLRRFGLPWS
ncbi:MAG: NADH-quinone oxidoreductase subunit NuoH [Acidimicrobiia bacterium]|nr:MAG: NADH-quinone oxidoreductase subunit NuoH [Acidimicrobiia bacterium]